MIRLPSGQRVAISSERARYHATRQGLRVDRETPPEALRSLVDILYLNEDGGGCKSSSAGQFTGYTLADRHWLARWRLADRLAFELWLAEGSQAAELEAARRRVIYDVLPRRIRSFPFPRRLYSTLSRRVAELPMRRARVDQWLKTLNNFCGKGISADELRWSGVIDFLTSMDPDRKIHRDDIRRRIGFPGLRLELTNELAPDGDYRLAFRETAVLESARGPTVIRRYQDDSHGYSLQLVRNGCGPPAWRVRLPGGEQLGGVCTDLQAAMALAGRHAASVHGLEAPLKPSDRYGWLTLAGGEDYREWLLTLPEFPASLFTPHFTERNLLLHFRTNRRVDHQGRSLLFIEEIQSDWHQRCAARRRQNPWDRPVPRAPFAREWLDLALKLILLYAVEEGIEHLAWAPGWVQGRRFHCGAGFLERLYDREMGRLLARLGEPWQARPASTRIRTLEPWLCMRREGGHWQVSSRDGRFRTRRRLDRGQAQVMVRRHSRRIDLEVPLFTIPGDMARVIRAQGLPLFGTRHHPMG